MWHSEGLLVFQVCMLCVSIEKNDRDRGDVALDISYLA